MSAPSTSQVPATAAVAPTEDCEPVYRWTGSSRIVRECKP
jgi:hypothetical protein